MKLKKNSLHSCKVRGRAEKTIDFITLPDVLSVTFDVSQDGRRKSKTTVAVNPDITMKNVGTFPSLSLMILFKGCSPMLFVIVTLMVSQIVSLL